MIARTLRRPRTPAPMPVRPFEVSSKSLPGVPRRASKKVSLGRAHKKQAWRATSFSGRTYDDGWLFTPELLALPFLVGATCDEASREPWHRSLRGLPRPPRPLVKRALALGISRSLLARLL
eukprot:scaffold64_cov248-Pinguiococcus_pyrenoidosus.AAC.7